METTQEQMSTLIAHDFMTKNTGVLDQKKIDAAVESITATTQSYPANGSVASFIFYLKFQVNVTGGKSFNGNAGGASTPGGGALIGDVYTSDINRLYKDTKSFQFNATPVYTSLIFFDGNSNVLGTFQAGAVSTVAGIGGGSGSWS
ncbi:VapA/VapB family virulence-associated protein [Lacinutrix sp. Hel_I_90]|uniref:VapA/VapB family virulence-associated protein n=1 Tax=Lacinutrix sp. Hel_I_90 TaxID=1249999 RepID=UPI0005C85611|nr:VapA/VapB family virulence-associated protein [Lacinutrix sp. Hel_I_90]